jgi:hypothetical protein
VVGGRFTKGSVCWVPHLENLPDKCATVDLQPPESDQAIPKQHPTVNSLCRRQWIQDTQAHVRQVLSSLENVDNGFPAIAIPGNAELHSDVNIANEQQQLALEQQDNALDRIEAAAKRVGELGLEIHRELGVRA